MHLENKTAVVIGSGRGIGRAISLAFAREGAKLVLMARTQPQLGETLQKVLSLGRDAIALTGDVSKKADIENLVGQTINRFGPPDILVNTAGISKRSLVVDFDDDAWCEVIYVNLFGTYLACKYFIRTMLGRRTGRIINISSIAGKIPQPFSSAYTASKHGIVGFTKTLAMEMGLMGASGITVNAVCPGATRTDMLEGEGGLFEYMSQAAGLTREEARKKVTDLNIQGRLLDPDEVAQLVVYLASDAASGVTGQAFTIDCGQIFQ